MSHTWDLCCVECLVGLPLGKWVMIDSEGKDVEGHWGGFRNQWDGRRVEGAEHRAAIADFCAWHAGHVIGVAASDELLELIDGLPEGDDSFRWIADVEELAAEPRPAPSTTSSYLTTALSMQLGHAPQSSGSRTETGFDTAPDR